MGGKVDARIAEADGFYGLAYEEKFQLGFVVSHEDGKVYAVDSKTGKFSSKPFPKSEATDLRRRHKILFEEIE